MSFWRGILPLALCASALGLGFWAWQPVQTYVAEASAKNTIALQDGPEGEAIWGVWTGHSYAFGIETGPLSVALIDAGSDPAAGAIIAQLHLRHMTPADVHSIILTHGHDEVQAGLAHFAQATIYVRPQDWALARRDVLPKPWLAKVQAKGLRTTRLPKLAMRPVWPGQILMLGRRQAQVVALPGHTWGSLAVVVANVAFVGDSVAGHNASANSQAGALSLFGSQLSVSPKHNSWALQRLGGASFAQMATTHAGVLDVGQKALSAWLATQSPAPKPR